MTRQAIPSQFTALLAAAFLAAACARELPPETEFINADGTLAGLDAEVTVTELGGTDAEDAQDSAATDEGDAGKETNASVDAGADEVSDATPDSAETTDTPDAEPDLAPDAPPEVDAPAETAEEVDAATDVSLTCPAPCTTADPCQTATCNPKTGQCESAPKSDGADCDDGQPCTQATTCLAGKCQGGKAAAPCGCVQDSDCAGQDDGKLCNGVFYCRKMDAVWTCEINPGSVVTCQQPGEACKSMQCQEPGTKNNDGAVAKCGIALAEDGTPCDDGKAWTIGDACISGQCLPSAAAKLCKDTTECVAYEDGDLCNGTLFCNKALGVCQVLPKSVVVCPTAADTTCQTMQCQKNTGKCQVVNKPELTACDDGLLCTTGEACVGGVCTATAGGKTCQCSADGDCAKYEDGDACNGKLFCNLQKGACEVNPATVVVCPTGLDTTCAKNVCDKASGACGLAFGPTATACDADGSPCTPYDHCDGGGKCVADTSVCQCLADGDCGGWEDGNLCNGTLFCDKAAGKCVVNPATVKSCPSVGDSACSKNLCAPLTGECATSAVGDGGGCDDGSACTTGDKCSGGKCSDVGQVVCDDGKVCTDDSCEPKAGCVFVDNTTPCSDGDACTSGDACKAGVCFPGGTTVCDDGNLCTDDACDKLTGCASTANAAGCDDGDACTVGDACSGSKCGPGAAKVCDDGKVCTNDACDKAAGCVFSANSASCDDGDACTAGDKCAGSTCLPGPVTGCDDAEVCTDDSCDPGKGCVYAANAATCTDANSCTLGDACTGGGCKPGSAALCDDGSPCTTDSCDKLKGCVNTALTDGVGCDDGNACTTGEKCASGKCGGSTPKVCGDGNPCSTGACDPKSGCVGGIVTNGTPCDDGNACTQGDGCVNKVCVSGSAVSCNDNNLCTNDSCDKVLGCVFAANGVACSDGNACTVGDVCAAKACAPGATPLVCDDGNFCTTDACDAKKGCYGVAIGDGQTCGTSATCKAGVCVGEGKALMVTAGALHTCLLTTLGTVMCWGRNSNGQLGDGTTADKYNPVPVTLPGAATSVSAGGSHTCALLVSGAVYCWGLGSSGQLGSNGVATQPSPVAVSGLGSGVVAITAGGAHTCAIKTGGVAVCWGLNSSSQLGNGKVASASVPVAVSSLDAGVTAIAAGGAHTCAIAFDGMTLCWGANSAGQLGIGSVAAKSEPELVPGLAQPAASMAAASGHTCAVKADGTLWCWGRYNAANGYLKSLANSLVPIKLSSGVASVAVGSNNTCALMLNGSVVCRGHNGHGELGIGLFDGADAGYVDKVVGLAAMARSVAVGDNHGCAVLQSGDVQCWGSNLYGQVGTGHPSYIAAPKSVVGLAGAVKSAATGGSHSCATLQDGGVYCWGSNSGLQAGQPSGQAYSKPKLIGSVGGGSTSAKQISTGANHSCATMTDGGAVCWGDNSKGQLGAPGAPIGPSGVANLGVASQLAAGGTFSCAVVQGAAMCWGANDSYQLGNGFTAASQTPSPVAGMASAVDSVAAGANFACALSGDAVKCWGAGTAGQTGDGTGASAKTPVQALGLASAVTAVVAGDNHACAVLASGALKCWGSNASGQVGDGSGTGPVKAPSLVTGLASGVLAAAAGSAHTCALLTGGGVKCWGDNASGQLGDLSTSAKATPAQVFGLTSGAVAVAAGGATSCALLAGGAVKCWGANTYGQLGTGDTVKKNIPTAGPLLEGIATISVGGNHACALLASGVIQCWGAGGLYQIGDGSAVATNAAPRAVGIAGTGAMAAGDNFTEVATLGSVIHWGASLTKANSCTGSPYAAKSYACWVPSSYTDKPLSTRTGSVAIRAGAGFVCDLTQAGAVRCEGDDAYFQVGVAPTSVNFGGYWYGNCYGGSCLSPSVTLSVVLAGGAKSLAAGSRHACAVNAAGAVVCWGRNIEGQTGNPSYFGIETWPAVVPSLASGVKAVTAGDTHTCALLDAGGVKCWGNNAFGQLGDNSLAAKMVPTAVVGLSSGVAAVAAGSNHTCALLSTGSVQCWGSGTAGQLGNGGIVDKLIPTDLPDLGPQVSNLIAGSTASHTCAILKDGTLKCWGQNLYGQIGDGPPITSSPVYVTGFAP